MKGHTRQLVPPILICKNQQKDMTILSFNKLFFKAILLAATCICICSQAKAAFPDSTFVSRASSRSGFPLAGNNSVAPLFISTDDYPGVLRAAADLQRDLTSVTGLTPTLSSKIPTGKRIVIIGTIGKSRLINDLVTSKKLNVADIMGRWETFVLQTINKPFPGVDQALVIAGSDKRGTIYGIYELSRQIGVSPWYWWADVPVRHSSTLVVSAGRHSLGEPEVKYRGIFINDEAPAFSSWARAKFGGVNHELYKHVFELLLRLRANYLWPAMWGNAFNDDDPLNRKTADEYGIVMGTSHHEPMDRAQQEWKRYGRGEWNYVQNRDTLRAFWRKGIENMGKAETVVTIGMRGDGDKAMEDGTNISLLEKIVADQRQIIADVTHQPAGQTPQLWALYKEVQDYYDKGMRVPDDVTLLLCDDNWGNIRKLPPAGEKPRKGGYGIYYHFDYVGGPRNYKWLNTNPITKVWEQMHLAYAHHARQLWVVNVGDLKPMEFPISFFLDYAWRPSAISASDLENYTRQWASQQFGEKYARQAASIIQVYSKFNGRRKPELLNEKTYSLLNFREFETMVSNYRALERRADSLYTMMPVDTKNAFYELVLHPVKACANLNDLYYTVALNHFYAAQGRLSANKMAERAKSLFKTDAAIAYYYNKELAGGKWDHMMDQTHIGYTSWQEPKVNLMPDLKEVTPAKSAALGIAMEGDSLAWPVNKTLRLTGLRETGDTRFLELFVRGSLPVKFKIDAPPFLELDVLTGTVTDQQRIYVMLNRNKLSGQVREGIIKISADDGTHAEITVPVPAKATFVANTFKQTSNFISIEAAHFQRNVVKGGASWTVLPDYGKTLSAITPMPVIAETQKPDNNSAHVEYRIDIQTPGDYDVRTYLAPSIDFTADKSLKYAVSIDEEKPQVISVNAEANGHLWNMAVADNINIYKSTHHIDQPGVHTLKIWVVTPAIVLEKIVISSGALPFSYLGPPESTFIPPAKVFKQ
ncbi:Glycosyl hydrolase family 67 N-terminus [Mucilaginibacter sp. OK268]|nr:Glycosyl hydrolase family 67 N-terminus [Mucilaginibacter sp. OK268]